jgi:hypothetical protein
MNYRIERSLLQIAIGLACVVPLLTAFTSLLRGAAWLNHGSVVPDLDSHFRYLSGIFLAIGIGFASCIPDVETKGQRFRLLGAMVIAGGFARLFSLLTVGEPSTCSGWSWNWWSPHC